MSRNNLETSNFKYSKGLSYLTNEVKEPKVEEITNEFKARKENKKASKKLNG